MDVIASRNCGCHRIPQSTKAGFLIWLIFLGGQITRVLAEVTLGEWAAGRADRWYGIAIRYVCRPVNAGKLRQEIVAYDDG